MRSNFKHTLNFDFFRTDDGAGAWYSTQFETTNILGVANPGIPDTYYDFSQVGAKILC